MQLFLKWWTITLWGPPGNFLASQWASPPLKDGHEIVYNNSTNYKKIIIIERIGPNVSTAKIGSIGNKSKDLIQMCPSTWLHFPEAIVLNPFLLLGGEVIERRHKHNNGMLGRLLVIFIDYICMRLSTQSIELLNIFWSPTHRTPTLLSPDWRNIIKLQGTPHPLVLHCWLSLST